MPYLELYCARNFPINPGYYFETCLMVDHREFEAVYGRDEYRIRTVFPSGRRLAGFGRHSIYNQPSIIEADPSAPFFAPIHTFSFRLTTNAILGPEMLGYFLELRAIDHDNHFVSIALDSADAEVKWEGRGQFTISLRPDCLAL